MRHRSALPLALVLVLVAATRPAPKVTEEKHGLFAKAKVTPEAAPRKCTSMR